MVKFLFGGSGRVWVLAAVLCLPACGGSGGPEGGTESSAGGSVVDVSKLENCAGFTASQAAAILGVSGPLEQKQDRMYDTLIMCAYTDPQDAMSGVSFSLSWEPTVEDMMRSMAEERGNLNLAKHSIEGATGTEEAGPSSEEISGIGEEAFWTSVNDTLVARVGNVRIQVILPNDVEKQREVARQVVAGLQ